MSTGNFGVRVCTRGVLVVLALNGGAAYAGDCWVDLYDKPEFAGVHVRIEGPLDLPNLKTLSGQDWSNRIESLAVGPKAEVVAYQRENFNETHQGPVAHPDAIKAWGEAELPAYHDLEISFGPGKKEHHLGELKFHKTINALKVRCR